MPAMIHANNDSNRKYKPKFPEKLYKVLQKGTSQHAVTWLPHGGSFKIINEKEFMDVVAPKYFKQKKIKTFYKQLQLWGFERVPRGIDEGAWYNKYFIRGCPTKLKQIQRRTNMMKSKALHGLSSPTPRMPSLPSLISPTATSSNRHSSPSAIPPMYIMPMPMQAYAERPSPTQPSPSPTSNMVHMLPKQTTQVTTQQQQPTEITPTVVSDDRHHQPPVTQLEVEQLSDSDSLLSDNDDLFLDSIIKDKEENVTTDVEEEGDDEQMCNMEDDEFSSYILSVLGDDFDTTPQCSISNDDNHDKEFSIEPVDYMLGDGKLSPCFQERGCIAKLLLRLMDI